MKEYLMNSLGGDLDFSLQWEEVGDIIRHWASCPDNGRLGSDYGYKTTLLSLLKEPQSEQASEQIILKMKADLPILSSKNISLTWSEHVPTQLTVYVDNDSTVIMLS